MTNKYRHKVLAIIFGLIVICTLIVYYAITIKMLKQDLGSDDLMKKLVATLRIRDMNLRPSKSLLLAIVDNLDGTGTLPYLPRQELLRYTNTSEGFDSGILDDERTSIVKQLSWQVVLFSSDVLGKHCKRSDEFLPYLYSKLSTDCAITSGVVIRIVLDCALDDHSVIYNLEEVAQGDPDNLKLQEIFRELRGRVPLSP